MTVAINNDYEWLKSCSRYKSHKYEICDLPRESTKNLLNACLSSSISSTPIKNSRYINEAKKRIKVKKIGSKEYFAKIKGLEGLWGYGCTELSAIDDLTSAIDDWVEIALESGVVLPKMGKEQPYFVYKAS